MDLQLDFSSAEEQRLKITQAQQEYIRDLYKQASEEIRKMANRAPRVPSDALRKEYLNKLQGRIDKELRNIQSQLDGTVRSNMFDTVQSVVKDASDFASSIGLTIEGAYSHVPADIVQSVISGQLYTGNWSLSRALWLNTKETQQDVQSIVAKGILENRSAYDIAKDLEKYVNPDARKDWEWSKVYPGTRKVVDYNAQRLARTMVSHAYQQAFVRTTIKNPFITQYQWQAAATERTCEICMERDGQLFDKDALPLDHPNGMCTYLAVMEGSMEDAADRLADWVHGNEDPELDTWAKDLYGKDWESKKEAVKDPNPDKLPDSVFKVVGPKGDPKSIEDCLKNTNPGRNSPDFKDYKKYHENCQRCVTAYELRRRGYDVIAQGFDGQYLSIREAFEITPSDFSSYVTMRKNSVFSPNYGGQYAFNNPNQFGKGSAAKTIIDAMTRWGDGSRAVLAVTHKSIDSGHVLNVENVNGTIMLVDSQINKTYTGESAIAKYMSMMRTSYTELYRTDTLEIKTRGNQLGSIVERA